jgi:hypothetical protein
VGRIRILLHGFEAGLLDGNAAIVVCRKEFDYAVVDFANGKPLEEMLPASRWKSCP